MVTGNIYVYFTEGILSTPLGFEIPYFEANSIVGFGVNMGIQSLYAIIGILGAVVIESCQALLNNTVSLFVALISMKTRGLSAYLNGGGKGCLESRILFRNILIQIQDFER